MPIPFVSLTSTSILTDSIFTTSLPNITFETSTIPIIHHLYYNNQMLNMNIISPKPYTSRNVVLKWFINQTTQYPIRTLIIFCLLATCFLVFLSFIIIRLHCTNRTVKKQNINYKSSQTNGKTYSQLHPQDKSQSSTSHDGHQSKKRVPRFLRHLHTNETKPTSFRLSVNGSNSGGDNHRLISTVKEIQTSPYRNSDCVLNEHCCVQSSYSQPVSSSSSLYHQINRLMLSGSDPPLPLPNMAQVHPHPVGTATLRSLKKGIDNTSSQTYSAVYSCDLVANLDIDQENIPKRLTVKRRSILKNTHSSFIQTKLLFLYVKNLIDCYALQPINRTSKEPIVIATADENRIQLSHALVSIYL